MDSRPSDETLLLAVAERDMGAFRTLYERHAGWLAIRLARRCNVRDLVADAIGDTFVAVWQKPKGFRGDGDIAAWLWGIAIRRLVSRLRTRGSIAAVFEHAEPAPAAEDQVLLSVEYGDIGQALARLSPEMRRGTRKCAAYSTWWDFPTSARSGSGPCPAASAAGSRWPRRCSARPRC